MVKTYKTVMDVFNDPFLIGFSREFDRLSALKKDNTSNYPPYDVLYDIDDNYLVSIAVAGYSQEKLSVTVDDGNLVVTGEWNIPDLEGYETMYNGIAKRKFTRKFALAEYMEVGKTWLKDGLLNIEIKKNVPEEKKPKQIEIIDHSANNTYQ
jgi:molecular chaperone IbpA